MNGHSKAISLAAMLVVSAFITMACDNPEVVAPAVHGELGAGGGGTQFWHLDRINQRNLPLDLDLYPSGSKGNNVQIFVIDTDVRESHGELEDNTFVVRGPFGNPGHTNGHGTAVSSLAAGAEISASWSADLIHVVTSESVSSTKSALLWVANNATRPAVINLSRGFQTNSQQCGFSSGCQGLLSVIVDIIQEADIPIVAAAGNDGADQCSTLIPAGVEDVITVAATDINDLVWDDSNFGPCVDLAAPGFSVRAADKDHDQDYRNRTGTSFAAPIVTSVIARYLSTHPAATPSQVRSWLLSQASQGVLVGRQGGGSIGFTNRLVYSPDNP